MHKLLKAALILPLLSGFFMFSAGSAQAWQACQYASTQARIQKEDLPFPTSPSTHPWKQSINIQLGNDKYFNVGSFHNNNGQFATDTRLRLIGPNTDIRFSNGNTYLPQFPGDYTLYVTTIDRYGAACEDRAYITVHPAQDTCPYSSTQARVQKDVYHNWKPSLTLRAGQSFNVGSFHDQTGQFAADTSLKITGPNGFSMNAWNAATINNVTQGVYVLSVKTNGKTGANCEESAVVNVVR